jgi:hypothetical protein
MAQAVYDVPITSDSVQELLAPGERAEQVLSHVIWYGDAKGNLAQAKKRVDAQAPEGTLILGDKELVFSSVVVEPNESEAPKSSRSAVRIDYGDIGDVQIERFMANQWVRVHTKDGQDHSFAVEVPGSTAIDREGTQAVGKALKSKTTAPADLPGR